MGRYPATASDSRFKCKPAFGWGGGGGGDGRDPLRQGGVGGGETEGERTSAMLMSPVAPLRDCFLDKTRKNMTDRSAKRRAMSHKTSHDISRHDMPMS